jgi:hypothetical protein
VKHDISMYYHMGHADYFLCVMCYFFNVKTYNVGNVIQIYSLLLGGGVGA